MASSTETFRAANSFSWVPYSSLLEIAAWKIVGLLVTPTTWFSRRNLSRLVCEPPSISRSREMSSSQIATPAAESSPSRSVLGRSVMSVPCRLALDLERAGKRGPSRGDHVVGGEAELLEQHLIRRARAEVFDADALAVGTDQILPRHGDARLDAHP